MDGLISQDSLRCYSRYVSNDRVEIDAYAPIFGLRRFWQQFTLFRCTA